MKLKFEIDDENESLERAAHNGATALVSP